MANRKAKRGLQVEKSLNKRSKVCSWGRLINFFVFFNLRKLCRDRTVGVPRASKSAVYAGGYIPATECSWISKIYLAGRGRGWQMRLHPLTLLDATQSSIIFLFLSSSSVKKKKKNRFCVNHRCGKMFSNFAARTLIRYRRCLCFSHAWWLLEKGKRVLWSDFETVLLCDAIALYELLSRGLFCFNQRVVFNIVKLLKLRKILCFINVGLYEILQRLI